MPTRSANPQGFHRVPETMAPRRWALWLLLATGCGFQTPLDVPGTNPSVSTGGAGGGGLTGSGGATRTGGVVGTAGGNAGPSGGCTMDTDHPGYLHCGPWKGYAWTLATDADMGSSISPSDFATADGLPFCAKGVLGRVDSAVGLLGFYVNQSADGDPKGYMGTWAVTGKGLKYEVSNPGGSPLRIQIQGAKGYPSETWCADISGSSSGFVTWATFNKECWFNFASEAYDGQTPLEQVMLLVPGINGREQAFNVCLISLYPY
jgi:hypothetical protein